VSDFSQENYGDVRSYAVAGIPLPTRRDLLNDYLEHDVRLAATGPDTAATARDHLGASYSPLANAAWGWDSAFGWTMVALDQMQDFVSAQTYALRYDAAARGVVEDRLGFAWAPRNAFGLSSSEFAAQTAALLDRLAVAVHDSGLPLVADDPGVGACGLPAQNAWCVRELPGASVSDGWAPFNVWAAPTVTFTTAPQTLVAGAVSAPMSVQLRIGGAATTAKDPVSVSLSSNSAAGAFSTAPEGPWTPGLTVTVPAGGSTSPPFYYRDTRAGVPVLTAAAAGYAPATQTVTVVAGQPVSVSVSPAAVTLRTGSSATFTARSVDAFGNQAPAAGAVWAVSPGRFGVVEPTTGATTTFLATATGSGNISATVSSATASLTASAALTVLPPPRMHVTRIGYVTVGSSHRVTVSVSDQAGRAVRGAAVAAALYRNGAWYAGLRGVTGSTGRVTFVRAARSTRAGCYTTRVRDVAARGFAWQPGTPSNRFCKRKAPGRS
jgi:hypothetical protein